MVELLKITERQGESEFDWFAIAEKGETNKEILTHFFEDLDEESNDTKESWYTSDWCSAVWVDSRQAITKEERATLKKLNVI
jgi:hypothetical protein|tara:strand:- start:369 stop:614 length:246 start_codon:yes stop_codon:yes gene_type:complete